MITPLKDQHHDRAHAGQQSAGESAEADADVVQDVVAEHRHVGAGVAAELLAVVGGSYMCSNCASCAARTARGSSGWSWIATKIVTSGTRTAPARPTCSRVRAHQAREIGEQEFDRAPPARRRRAVEQDVAALHQRLQARRSPPGCSRAGARAPVAGTGGDNARACRRRRSAVLRSASAWRASPRVSSQCSNCCHSGWWRATNCSCLIAAPATSWRCRTGAARRPGRGAGQRFDDVGQFDLARGRQQRRAFGEGDHRRLFGRLQSRAGRKQRVHRRGRRIARVRCARPACRRPCRPGAARADRPDSRSGRRRSRTAACPRCAADCA